MAERLRTAGVAATAAGRPVDGVRLLRAALGVLRPDGPDRQIRGRVLLSLAFAEVERGRTAAGLRAFDEAAALLTDRTMVDSQHGALLARAGRLAEALPYLDRAVQALAAAGDLTELSRALLNRGYTLMNAGRLRQSRVDLLRCLRVARAGGPHSVAVKAVQNLGYLAFFTGDVPQALRYLDEAARGCARLPSYRPAIAADKARVLLSVGLADDACRELEPAIEAFREQRLGHLMAEAELVLADARLLAGHAAGGRRAAASARRRFLRRGNHTWAELAALYELRAALEDGAQPRSVARAAARLAERLTVVGLPDDARFARLLAARAHLRAGEVKQAAALLHGQRPPPSTAPLPLRLAWHLAGAELAVATGRPGTGLRRLRSGLRCLQRHRSTLGSLDLQTGVAAHGARLAATGLTEVLRTGRPRQVLEWAELMRAQAFRVPGPPLRTDVREALAELRQVRFAQREAELRGAPLGRLRTRRSELERSIRETTWLADGPGASRPLIGLGELRQLLAARDEAMVLYLDAGERLAALVVNGPATQLVDLGSFAEVVHHVRRLRADLDTMAVTVPRPMLPVIAASRRHEAVRLDELLVSPLRRLIGDRALVVVPTGALFGLPWSQLPALRSRPVVVAPSATIWADGCRRQRSTDGTPVLAAGPGLEHAVREILAIADIYPAAERLTGVRATPAAVLDRLDGAPLAHLAAHGHHQAGNALFSALDLATGPLVGYDLLGLHRAPRLVVLSACQLGLSEVRAGDEIVGMVAALLLTGSATVVASVARPLDHDIPEVMVPFHRSLAAGVPPATALADATAHVEHSSFVCFGSS